MASMRDIQRRRNSIASTQQITKAMKLVSTVKLQRTREKAEECKPYFNHMYATVTSMLARTGIVEHPYLKSGKSGKKGVIVISSNRGLAGGYNSNIVKMLTQGELEGKELLIYNIGRKGHEALERKGYEIAEDYSEVINSPSVFGCGGDQPESPERFRGREDRRDLSCLYQLQKHGGT